MQHAVVARDAARPLARLPRRTETTDVVEDPSEAIDQLDRTINRMGSLPNLLDAAVTASLARTGIQQNVDLRRISAWAAMAAVPTRIAGIPGVNVENMPELTAGAGHPW